MSGFFALIFICNHILKLDTAMRPYFMVRDLSIIQYFDQVGARHIQEHCCFLSSDIRIFRHDSYGIALRK